LLVFISFQAILLPTLLHLWIVFAFMGNFKKNIVEVMNELDLNSPLHHYVNEEFILDDLAKHPQLGSLKDEDFV